MTKCQAGTMLTSQIEGISSKRGQVPFEILGDDLDRILGHN